MATENWHLDKRVPLAMIVAILIQTGGALWWASTINSQVRQNTNDIARIVEAQLLDREARQVQAVQLGRIEEQTRTLSRDMTRLLNMLERNIP